MYLPMQTATKMNRVFMLVVLSTYGVYVNTRDIYTVFLSRDKQTFTCDGSTLIIIWITSTVSDTANTKRLFKEFKYPATGFKQYDSKTCNERHMIYLKVFWKLMFVLKMLILVWVNGFNVVYRYVRNLVVRSSVTGPDSIQSLTCQHIEIPWFR